MIVHQLLHGYSQGHTLLASSVKLTSTKDADMIMTLSDWSEYKSPSGDDSSYITAYPLSDSDYYAIAKTWYADEMERPGCVWTHTLLFNLHDLANNTDVRLLLNHFKRPIRGEYDTYSKNLIIEDNNILVTPLWKPSSEFSILFVGDIYKELLDKQVVNYRVKESSLFYQEFIMSIIRHVPPLMLKDLSFCSGSSQIRKINGNPMNLQFLSSTHDKKAHVPKKDLDSVWVDIISQSIINGNEEIPTLLSIYTEDIRTIDNLRAIISVFQIVEKLPLNNKDVSIFREFLNVVHKGFPKSCDGVLLKTRLMSKGTSLAFCDERAFIYEMGTTEHFSSFDYSSFDYNERAKELYNKDYIQYFDLLCDLINNSSSLNDYGTSIITSSVEFISVKNIEYLVNERWNIFMSLASIDNKILNNEYWIFTNDNHFKDALRLLDRVNLDKFDYWHLLFDKALSLNICLSKNMIGRLKFANADIGLKLLNFIQLNPNANICQLFINEIITDNLMLSWLEKQNIINKATAKILMSFVSPLSNKVKERGSSIWRPFYDLINSNMDLDYYVYLFTLSYNWKNDITAFNYHVASFYPIHKAIANNILADNLLYGVEKFTKPLAFWNEWDKCKKLRNGLVDRMIDERYTEDILYNLTPDSDLNQKLIKTYKKRR